MLDSCGKKCLEGGKVLIKFIFVLILLYLFICSLDVLQDAFQLVGGRTAGKVLSDNELLNNPICGLMLGVIVTVLVQSSSTSTSIVVSMVGSGLLKVEQAIPIIMGSNIGTTVTNTIVSLSQSTDREMFEKAFAGATVHDMFNWMTVIILMIIESISGYLERLTRAMTEHFSTFNSVENPQFLKVITKPLTQLIVQVDKKVIEATVKQSDREKFPLMRRFCKEVVLNHKEVYEADLKSNATESFVYLQSQQYTFDVRLIPNENDTTITWSELDVGSSKSCQHIFVDSGLSDTQVGAILLVLSLISMILCLVILVKILNSLLSGPLAAVVKKFINSDLPGPAACLTGYVAILVGAMGTILVQSSSVFTSALIPLVGLGLVDIERVYPLTLGSNIGTTITGILAALTADSKTIRYSLQIALVHLFFNITGIIIFYPIPFMRKIPISMAKRLAKTTARHRWFALVYLVSVFLIFPLIIFALSFAGWYVLVAVLSPVVLIVIAVVVIDIIRSKRPEWLPEILQSWDFLPEPMRSLDPYERCFGRICCCNRRVLDSARNDESTVMCKKRCHCFPTSTVTKTNLRDRNNVNGMTFDRVELEIVEKDCHSIKDLPEVYSVRL